MDGKIQIESKQKQTKHTVIRKVNQINKKNFALLPNYHLMKRKTINKNNLILSTK